MSDSYFPRWRVQPPGAAARVVGPDERLSWPQMIAMGVQHVVAMFGSTVLAPLLMGFDPNLCIFMSGVGTLLFFALVGGRVPSYLGSSFAFSRRSSEFGLRLLMKSTSPASGSSETKSRS